MNQEKQERLLIHGKNAILEALDSNQSINKIWLLPVHDSKGKELKEKARAKKVPIVDAQKEQIFKLCFDVKGGKHISAVAELSPVKIYDEKELYKQKDAELLVLLANIEDPHNVGAIMRSCHAFGVDGVLMPGRKTSPITNTVVSSSAGAALKQKTYRISNISTTIKRLKDAGYWIYGTNVRSDKTENYSQTKFDRKTVLIIGNEGKGVPSKVLEHCDFSLHIPCEFESLNVSVATGVILSKIYADLKA